MIIQGTMLTSKVEELHQDEDIDDVLGGFTTVDGLPSASKRRNLSKSARTPIKREENQYMEKSSIWNQRTIIPHTGIKAKTFHRTEV